MTHICVSKLTIIGSDNGYSPGRRLAIIRTNAGIFLLDPWEQNLMNSGSIFIFCFQSRKCVWKLAAILSWPQCVKHIENDEILSMTVQTLSYLYVPRNSGLYCQWCKLIYFDFMSYFPHTRLLTSVVTKEDIIMWCELNMNDGTYKTSRVSVFILYLHVFVFPE